MKKRGTSRLLFCVGCFLSMWASEQAFEKPMVVVIPSYNNSKYYQKNLDSVFSQHYTNYRVIYIDDCSPDGTGGLVQAYVRDHHQEHRVTLIKNEQRRGALANHYTAAHLCKNREIIVHMDGDDWFKHDCVLATVNNAYQDPDVWLTYSQHEMYPPQGKALQDRVIPAVIKESNAYREYRWVASALRTFYAGLFKRIKLQDLLYKGAFFDVTCDLAFMFPMLEMTGGKFKCIDEILYVYNVGTGLNDFKLRGAKQLRMDNIIRARDKYEPLKTPPYLPLDKKDHRAELIIFAENAEHLQTLLTTVALYASGIGHITVFYAPTDGQSAQEKQAYQECKAQFSEVAYIHLDNQTSLKPALLSCLSGTPYDYLMFARDTNVITNFVDLAECAGLLEKTGAYGFYLNRGKDMASRFISRDLKTPPLVEFQPGFYAWQFSLGEYDWRIAHTIDLTLYRKKDVGAYFSDLSYESMAKLETLFKQILAMSNNIGAFFSGL